MLESLLIKTSGATLAVRQYHGKGEPIVLLHGGPGMGDYFGSFPELLSPPYRVLSYDQRGTGGSSRQGSYHFMEPTLAWLGAGEQGCYRTWESFRKAVLTFYREHVAAPSKASENE